MYWLGKIKLQRPITKIGLSIYSVLTLIFFTLVLSSITTSSLNHPSLREFSDKPNGLLFGSPNPIRGDEFAKSTPITLSRLSANDIIASNKDSLSPMDVIADQQDSNLQRFIQAVSFAPELPLKLIAISIPLDMGYSLLTWMGVWIFSISFTYWCKRFKLSTGFIVWGLLLTVIAPSSIWWSFWPVINASSLLAALALIDISIRMWEKRNYLSIPLGVLGILELFPYANLYFPWAITFTLVLGVPLILFSISNVRYSRKNTLYIAANGVLFATLFLTQMYLIADQAKVLFATEYPGVRRFYDSSESFANFADAPFAFVLQLNKSSLNGSELSSPWNLLLLLAIFTYLVKRKSLGEKVFMTASFVAIGALLLWTLVAFPNSIATHLPIFPLLSPVRISAVIGIASMLFILLIIRTLKDSAISRSTFEIFIVAFFVVIISMSIVRNGGQIPITPWAMWAISIVIALIFSLVLSPHASGQLVALVLGVLFVCVSSRDVFPIQRGLGDLNGKVAQQLVDINQNLEDNNKTGIWAADTWELPALLRSNGLSVLTGEQIFGPSKKWKIIDPNSRYLNAYNRGASTVYINWLDDDVDAVIENPQADQIIINVGPCNDAFLSLGVDRIIATRPLQGECLTGIKSFAWSSIERYVYVVNEN